MRLFSLFKKKKRKLSEGAFSVMISEGYLLLVNPKGKIEKIKLEEIRKVIIQTNDTGPWGTDLWWIVSNDTITIAIPNGASGEEKLVEVLQDLPTFNNEEMIAAMVSTSIGEFICLNR